MKSIKEQADSYLSVANKLLESKDPALLSDIQILRNFIKFCEKKSQDLDEKEKSSIDYQIKLLKMTLKTLRVEKFNLAEMKLKLNKYCVIMEKASKSKEPMKNFSEKIKFLEKFIVSLYFVIEDLSHFENAKIEMDLIILELYTDFVKNKYVHFLQKEHKKMGISKQQNEALIQFLNYLKFHSENEIKNKTRAFSDDLKKICQYLLGNPQLFCDLEMNQSVYLPKEDTFLNYTVQIKQNPDGFQLYVNLKRKLENWKKQGGFKTVKKNLMLIKGVWVDGADAVVYKKEDALELTQAEAKRVEKLNPLYVHIIEPASFYRHHNQLKQSFVSKLADCSLFQLVYEDTAMQYLTLYDIFIICYSSVASVAYIHEPTVNIIHNDIKADNFLVFFDTDGVAWVKISDFGLSTSANESKMADREKMQDTEQLAFTLKELLERYSTVNNLKEENHPILADLNSAIEIVFQPNEKQGIQSSDLMDIFNAILGKIYKNDHTPEAGLLKQKIENYYQNKPLKYSADSSLLIGFLMRQRPRRNTSISFGLNTYEYS